MKKSNAAYSVLVVEDHEPNVLIASMYLDELGYKYDIARSGDEALKKLSKQDFSLILMDISMEGRDGIETTQAIRSKEMRTNQPNIPIIALTADGDKERCLEAGMDDYITKPIKLPVLRAKLLSNIDRD